MATLTNKTIASTYTSLLKLEGDTGSTVAASSGNAVQVKTGDNDATPLYLNTDRVGIGGQPNATLSVRSANNTIDGVGNVNIFTTDSVAANKGGGITFGGMYTGSAFAHWGAIYGRKDTADTSQTGGYLQFATRANGADSVEVMRLTSAGDLQLQERLTFSGTNNTSAAATINLNSNNYLYIAGGTAGLIIGDDALATAIQFNDASTMAFDIGGGTRAKLDSNSRISLSNNSSGANNTIFGKLAGDDLATGGNNNVFIGENAGHENKLGENNVALGYNAMDASYSSDTTDAENDNNVFIGYNSGGGVWTGSTTGHASHDNIGIGTNTLDGAMQGSVGNAAIGSNALTAITSGGYNTIIGWGAGAAITTGDSNVALGSGAITTATTTSSMVAIGGGALYSASAGQITTNGSVAVGINALNELTSGTGNVAVGFDALGTEDDANYSTAVGYEALKTQRSTNGSNTAVGYHAATLLSTGSNNTVVGSLAGDAMTDNAGNVIVGKSAFSAADAGENYNVVIGGDAGTSINNGSADYNVLIGQDAGTGGTGAMASCIAIGGNAMNSTATNAQTGTIAIGHDSLTALTSGAGNVAVGYRSGFALSLSGYNVAIGEEALEAETTGQGNVAIGYQALHIANQGGGSTVNSKNTIVGFQGGDGITDGAENTGIGAETAFDVDADNQTVIGFGATSASTGANSVVLGNASVTDVYMAQDSGATVHGAIFTQRATALGVGQTPTDENSGELGAGYLNLFRDDTTDVKQILFGKNGAEIGSISTTTSTSFNTSSDYRLKENEVQIPNGLENLNKLKPYKFNWKSENDADGKPTRTVDGFFAHEVAEIIPEAVIGEKDAVYSDGKIKVQSMDYSKVVPLLVKAVQELSAKVTELESKLK